MFRSTTILPMFLVSASELPFSANLAPRLRVLAPPPKACRGAVARDQRRAAKVRALKRAKRLGHA